MSHNPTRRGVVAGAGALAAGLSAPWIARAQSYKPEYKLSTVVGAAFPWGLRRRALGRARQGKDGGTSTSRCIPALSLVGGDQTKEFTAMRQGVIDMAVGSTINWSPQVKELNLFSLPFLMPDHKAIDALTQGEVGKKLFEIIGAKDVVPLAWGENGFRELTNSKHAIRTPADLKGLKIRVVGSPAVQRHLHALGANPTQMSWADAQPALPTGAVDGQENPLTIFTVAKLHTVGQKYRDAVGLRRRSADLLGQQGASGMTLSPEDQKIVREAAVEAGRVQQGAGAQGRQPRPILRR